MKIEGLKILDSNYYHQITINGNKIVVQRLDNNGRIISKNDSGKYEKSANSISTEIRKLDNEAIIDRVVEYYLDYNKITGIYENVEINGRLYCIFESSGDFPSKNLRFRVMPNKQTARKIMDRYRFDRDDFLINLVDVASKFEFCFENAQSYYKIGEDYLGSDKGIFGLCVKKDQNGEFEVLPSELAFFDRALSTIMGDELALTSEVDEYDRFGFRTSSYIRIDSESYKRTITAPRGLAPEIERIVGKHNEGVWIKRRTQERIEGQVYQMKMEGF